MIDDELVDNLKNIINYCNQKIVPTNNPKTNTMYITAIPVLRALLYCIKFDKIEQFNIILEFTTQESRDYIAEFNIIKNEYESN